MSPFEYPELPEPTEEDFMPTTPPTPQLPEEVKPSAITPSSFIVYPLWLWHDETGEALPRGWTRRLSGTFSGTGLLNMGFTHWLPDQSEAPTVTPYLTPRPPAPVDAEWAQTASREIAALSTKEANNGMCVNWRDVEDIILRHAPAADELARLREERDGMKALFTDGGVNWDALNALMARCNELSEETRAESATLRQERDELAKLLGEFIQYREGRGPFDFSSMTKYERANAAHDALESLLSRIRAKLQPGAGEGAG